MQDKDPSHLTDGAAREIGNCPAFPVRSAAEYQAHGISIRDYMAAKAMQGFMANKSNPMLFDPKGDAEWAYTIADAMIKAGAA